MTFPCRVIDATLEQSLYRKPSLSIIASCSCKSLVLLYLAVDLKNYLYAVFMLCVMMMILLDIYAYNYYSSILTIRIDRGLFQMW